jgi:hypothetical protein
MSTSNISPEIKDKLVEHLNEMLSAENAAVVTDLIQGYRNAFCRKARSNCNAIKMRPEDTKKD